MSSGGLDAQPFKTPRKLPGNISSVALPRGETHPQPFLGGIATDMTTQEFDQV